MTAKPMDLNEKALAGLLPADLMEGATPGNEAARAIDKAQPRKPKGIMLGSEDLGTTPPPGAGDAWEPPDDGWSDWCPTDDDDPSAAPSVTRPVRLVESMPAQAPLAKAAGPTADDPLKSLLALAKVATLGRDNFLQLASVPVDYLWQDLVVSGTITVLAGAPGEGKTTLLFLILAARLQYGPPVSLLGRLIVPSLKGQYVVLIEGEHGESSAARKLVKSFEMLGLDNTGLDRLILVARKAVRIGSLEWGDIVRLCRAGLVSDIALDTVARVAPANADNEAEQVAIFDTVAKAIEAAPEGKQPTVWALAHTRKNGSGGLADVSGSAQRTGQADSVLMLKADKSGGQVTEVTVTFEKLREPPDDHPEPATFRIENDCGAPVLHQGTASISLDDSPLEVRITELLVVAPRTKTELSEKLKRSRKDVDDALSNLFASREIVTDEVLKRGVSRKVFKLSGPTPYTGRVTGRVNPNQSPDEQRT